MAAPKSRRQLVTLLLLALATLAALAWLGWRIGGAPSQQAVTARPALWHASRDGREIWLFGTIHAVPKGEQWLSPAITQAAQQSDVLLLEVTGLDVERASRAVFERLGKGERLPPIAQRLAPEDAAQFQVLEGRHELHGLQSYDSWAAALLINAAAASDLSLSAEDGGEAVLTRLFEQAGKPVRGLETIEGQLGLFDRLPPEDHRQLLTQSVREADQAPTLYRQLHDAWARGDIATLEKQFLKPLQRAPGLRLTLLDTRNRDWTRAIDTQARRDGGTLFVAVGAGHLVGEGSVQSRLARLGWRIERRQ